MSYPVWRIMMDKDVLLDHEKWLASGRSGPGRLMLEGQNLQGARAPLMFPAARFVRCDLSKATFPLFRLDDIELVECRLDEAVLDSTDFNRASIERTAFDHASLQLAHFDNARIRDCSFTGSDMQRARFLGATFDRVSFGESRLIDAVLDDARFVDCDLRDADLSRREEGGNLARTTRTRFERCDLRGANFTGRRLDGTVFDRCQMDGMIGKPTIEGPYTIVAPLGTTIEAIERGWS